MSKGLEVITTLLGDDFFEDLKKFELIKQNTQTAVDHEEVETALRIVPKAVMAWLFKNLGEMKISESKEIAIPFPKAKGATIQLTKIDNDVYSGQINSEGHRLTKFLYRTLPSIGLVLLTTFELYDIDSLSNDKPSNPDIEQKINALIEEKLALRDLISKVVDKKIAEREAVEALVLTRLKTATVVPEIMIKPQTDVKKNKLKLKDFLQKTKDKKSHLIKMNKSESFCCPDCGNKIFDHKGFTGCVCFGEDMNKSVALNKAENGYKITFSNKWEKENVEMLLKILRKQEVDHE